MRNILITGGAGFIGSNFIRYLLKSEDKVIIHNLDLLTYAGNLENLKDLPDPDRYHFIQGDICDRGLVDHVLKNGEIDLVVNFAAESHVDRSFQRPEAFIRTNIQGTFILLEAAKAYWNTFPEDVRDRVHFHHISTDEVYGSLASGAPGFTEESQISPNSPYAASKAASDHLVRSYFHTYGLPITITNCSNNYGPNQYPEKLIPLIIQNLIDGKPILLYGDGKQIRDWLYVEDHCKAIWRVIKSGTLGETYHVGGENQPTNLEIVAEICRVIDRDFRNMDDIPVQERIEFISDRPAHDRRYAMDISKIKRELDWSPEVDLITGLESTVAWYLNNQDWVERIKDKKDYQAWIEKNYHTRQEPWIESS